MLRILACLIAISCLAMAQPLSVNVTPDGTMGVVPLCTGQSITFTANATGGTSPYAYQWTKNNVGIGGATGTTYTIPAGSLSDEATYNCFVQDGSFTVASDPTPPFLDVQVPASITGQPSGGTICVGTTVSMTVNFVGDPNPTALWFKDMGATPLASGPSGNGSTYTITSGMGTSTIQITNAQSGDAGSYQALVSNPCGLGTVIVPSSSAVWVTDTVPPVITLTVPTPVTIECGLNEAPGLGAPTGIAQATDTCTVASLTYSDVVTAATCPLVKTISRTWTAMDDSGNTSTMLQTINVQDTAPPSVTPPANITVSNDSGSCDAVVTFAATATDNCGPTGLSITYDVAPGSAFPVGTTTVTATATDGCGNTASVPFTVTVNDTEAPTVTCPMDILQANDAGTCGAVVTYAATATDNCAGVTIAYSPPSGSIFLVGGPTSVMATATDAAGNTATCSFNVTVNDTEAPVLVCPANVTVPNDSGSCDAAVTFAATATDACDGPVTPTYDIASGSVFPLGTTTVTATAVDMAGNMSSCTFDVTVIDSEAPVLVCPANIIAANDAGACDAVVSFSATATDNCDGPVTPTYDFASGSVFPMGTTTVTATATDAAGNTATCMFTVTVNDTEAPVITIANATVECGTTGTDPAVTGFPTVTDNCDSGLTATHTDTSVTGTCPIINVISRTWTVADSSSNVATYVQTITVQDTQAPVITSCPPSFTASVDATCSYTLADLTGSVGYMDICNVLPVVVTQDIVGTITGIGPHVVTFTATDTCSGQSSTCTMTVTLIDTTPPTVTCAGTVPDVPASASCQAMVPNVTGLATATDNCGMGAPALTQSPAAGTLVGLGMTTITVTATDGSGNMATCTTTFNVVDLTPPTVTCPAGTTTPADGSCMAPVPDYAALATGTDNCTTITFTQVPAAGTMVGLGLTTVTVTGTDLGGNTAACSVGFTVTDTTPPTVTCPTPAPATADAACMAPVPDLTGAMTSDNCAGAITVTQAPAAGTLVGLGANMITVTATDAAGNMASCVATFQVDDITQPALVSCAPAQNLSALEPTCTVPLPDLTGMAIFTDCNGPVVVTQSPMAGTVLGLGQQAVLFTATDAAMNTNTCTTIVTVIDDTPPVVTCGSDPAPATADAACQAPVPDVTLAASAIDCNGPVPLSQSPAPGTLVGVGVNPIVVTATDAAGNTATCTVNFTVNDTTPPALVSCANPADLPADVMCEAIMPDVTGGASFTDCNGVNLTQSPSAGTTAFLGANTVTVTATDNAGNMNTCTITVTVVDGTDPVLVCGPAQSANADASCLAALPDFVATSSATDCNGPVAITQSPLAGVMVGAGITTVTVTATDAGGNTATCMVDFTVTDITPPTITCALDQTASADSSCMALVPDFETGSVASDTCGGVSVSQSPAIGTSVGLGVTVVTVTATDTAGNTTTCTANFTVSDTTPPTLTCPPAVNLSADATCMAAIPDVLGGVTVTDDCDTGIVPTQSPVAGTMVPFPTVATITVTAVDTAGNTGTCTVLATVIDDTPPTITCPADLTVSAGDGVCGTLVTYPAPVATDDCSTPVTVVCTPPSGSMFPAGSTVVTCVATDGAGNSATCTFTVKVIGDWKALATYPVPNPVDVIIADMGDGLGSLSPDGNPDLVAASNTGDIWVLYNDGNANFGPAVPFFYYGTELPVALAAADFTGDGAIDIAVLLSSTGATSRVSILDNAAVPIELVSLSLTSTNPVAIDTGEVDGIFPPDLLVLAAGSGLGVNSGADLITQITAVPAVLPLPVTGLSIPADGFICDLDADGVPDMAVADSGNGVQLFNVTNAPLVVTDVGTLPSPGSPAAITCGDADGDQFADDIILAQNLLAPPGGVVSVWVNTNAGSPGTLSLSQFPVREDDNSAPYGLVDVVAADLQSDTVYGNFPGDAALRCANDVVIIQNGSPNPADELGQFLRFSCAPPPAFGAYTPCNFVVDPTALATADLNGDFLPDLVTANGDGTLKVLCADIRARGDLFGSSCPPLSSGYGFIPTIDATPLPIEGLTASINLSGAPALTGCVLGVSAIPFESILAPGCSLYLGNPIYLLPSSLGTVTDGSGQASFAFPVPVGLFTGDNLYFQWAVFDTGAPDGFSLTEGLHARIGS